MPTRRALVVPFLAAGTLAALAPSVAAAQGPGLGIGASVGANVPQGKFSDGAKTGLVANGFAELRLGGSLGLRGELFWSRSDIDSPIIRKTGNVVLPSSGTGTTSGNVDLVGGIASVVLPLTHGAIQPYLIGGIGAYRRRVAQDISGTIDEFKQLRESDRSTGYSGGAGIRLNALGHALFVEGRYHSVNTSPERTTFIPVTVGFTF